MKIAFITYNLFPLGASPKDLPAGRVGAIEHLTKTLIDSLVSRGHDVTVFASGDSRVSAKLRGIPKIATYRNPLTPDLTSRIDFEYLLNASAIEEINKNDFDIVHTQSHVRTSVLASFINKPTVSTIHSISSPADNAILSDRKGISYVSISDYQRKLYPKLDYVDTVYHGIDLGAYKNNISISSYLAFIGRIAREKGLEKAVSIANKTKKSLWFAGTVKDDYQSIFDKHVLPFIDGKKIKNIGPLDHKDVGNFLGKARALLFPIQWEEPFGLVLAEAMATGTPVVAFARGSVPEVIKDGVTGFIINSSEKDKRGDWIIKRTGNAGMVEAVNRIYSMPEAEYKKMRHACRKHVEDNFTIDKMVDNYEKVYDKVIKNWKKKKK